MSNEEQNLITSDSAYYSSSNAVGNLFSIILRHKYIVCIRKMTWEQFLGITKFLPLYEEPGDIELTWRMIQALQECMIFNDEEVQE